VKTVRASAGSSSAADRLAPTEPARGVGGAEQDGTGGSRNFQLRPGLIRAALMLGEQAEVEAPRFLCGFEAEALLDTAWGAQTRSCCKPHDSAGRPSFCTPRDEAEAILAERYARLTEAGYPPTSALVAATHVEVDIGVPEQLVDEAQGGFLGLHLF
jgi:hypothetical protein